MDEVRKQMVDQKTREKEHYSVMEMFYNGCSFANCGELCKKMTLDNNSAFLSNPMIINYAFACEVFLKTLLEAYQLPQCQSHKLNELFQKLPEKVQLDIESELEKKVGALTDAWGYSLLEQVSNAFVEWRYIYEKFPSQISSAIINTGYLTSLCEVLRNKCCMSIFHKSYKNALYENLL